MKIPTAAEWGEIEKGNLDAEMAFKNFVGKSFSVAEEMFEYNAFHYQEDLMSMPPVAFNYYAPAYSSYIVSEKSKEDSDGASCFLHMVIELLCHHRKLATRETERVLLDAAKLVSKNQTFYEADIDIYGEFTILYDKIVLLHGGTSQGD